MPLPDCIEIVPLKGLVRAEITMPGSKSITNRALILAALAQGETTLAGALWSEDTQVMVEALQKLGFDISVQPDPNEACNRTIQVKGLGGKIPNGGTGAQPLELFVGNAGTAARFLAAFVCLGSRAYRLHGVPRMHERPQAALFQALRELGYAIDCVDDKLPAVIQGTGPAQATCSVSIAKSSQFASALLLCANTAGWSVQIVGEDTEESSYVEMTKELIQTFPKGGGVFRIEPDASSGSYFWAAGWLHPGKRSKPIGGSSAEVAPDGAGSISDPNFEMESPSCGVCNWPKSTWQIDSRFPLYLPLPAALSRKLDLGDSIMTAVALAPMSSRQVRFTDLGRLRVQECERVAALRTELTRCGARVVEEGDTLTVFPSPLHGAEIETYADHRMAMCFAILGLKVPGIRIKNPACVKKTFPNFFQKLASPPPHGLGATILDATTGRTLRVDQLFAG